MSSKTWGYARVSSNEQNLDRQIEALHKMGVSDREIIVDKASGKTLDRPGSARAAAAQWRYTGSKVTGSSEPQ